MIYYCFVSQEKIKLSLESVVFFVNEIDLSIKFLYNFFVVLLNILHSKLFVVLTALVKLT